MRDLERLCNAVEAVNTSVQLGFGALIAAITIIWVTIQIQRRKNG